jgi:hypothetical protein
MPNTNTTLLDLQLKTWPLIFSRVINHALVIYSNKVLNVTELYPLVGSMVYYNRAIRLKKEYGCFDQFTNLMTIFGTE